MSERQRIIIIGDGIAGHTAARHIAAARPKTNVTLVGVEREGPYSACALPDYLAGRPRNGIFLPPFPTRGKVEVITGAVADGIDPAKRLVSVNGAPLPYDKLIIATGSRAFVPPVPGADLPGNFTVKTLGDVENIKAWGGKTAVVIGSGAIGLETAMALKERGLAVTVVEMLDRILPTAFDQPAADQLARELEAHDIAVQVSRKVVKVAGDAKVSQVCTDAGDLPCDLVIWAAGVRSNTDIAAQAGLEIGRFRGIRTDAFMATSMPDIYACGDCVETFSRLTGEPTLSLLWGAAKEQAVVAASNCIGEQRQYPGAFGVMIEIIGSLTAVSAGFTASAPNAPADVEAEDVRTTEGYRRLVTAAGKIIGVQLVGDCRGAGALIAAVKKGLDRTAIAAVLANPVERKRAPWFQSASRFA